MGLYLLVASDGWAQDMRAASIKADQDRKTVQAAAQEAAEKILKDRRALLAEVNRLETLERELEQTIKTFKSDLNELQQTAAALSDQWAQKELEFRELTGTIRVAARALETIIRQSPFTANQDRRLDRIQPLMQKNYFPGIDDIGLMTDLFLEEIQQSGEVSFKKGAFVDRSGSNQQGMVLLLGKFTAIYQTDEETGFLRYSEEGQRFYAVDLPSRGIQRNLKKYLKGQEEAVYLDLSRGAALLQITRRQSLGEQIQGGGPIVWPLLAIALLAAGLVVERILRLNRVRGNTDRLMDKMNTMADEGEWQECENLIKPYKKNNWPVVNVLAAGLAGRHEDRETLESILQEAILREVPRLEQSLSVLAILGAIAPLLGLLGTVTGMIDTFRVITLYGTGDPKMMSGGISEALITTELGLAIAIPIMLFHTFLSRRVDNIVGDMEEKAVALTNIIQKERGQNGPAGSGL